MTKKILVRIFISFTSLLLISFSRSDVIYKVSEGSITFISEAPLETVSATSEKLSGLLDTTTREFAFSVLNTSFQGFNSVLQREHFNESYMESDKFPRSTFSGKIIEVVSFRKPGVYTVRAKGLLNVHGVEQERIIKCELTIDNVSIKVTANFDVTITDHEISIPKIVFDKISPEIKVVVKATLLQKQE